MPVFCFAIFGPMVQKLLKSGVLIIDNSKVKALSPLGLE
jgi:hypothetical protein